MQHLLPACASTNKLLPTSADSTGDYDAGEEICDRAETLGVRAVVLLHHGKGMMQEMLFGKRCQCGVFACQGHCCSACVAASCTLEPDSIPSAAPASEQFHIVSVGSVTQYYSRNSKRPLLVYYQ